MEGRGGLRCSARLNGGGGGPDPPKGSAPGAPKGSAPARGRPAQAAALAADRRARAAERAREVEDSPGELRDKCRRLARALRNAKHLVVYTGAGISTAADIPDYRGPHGVWTRLQRGETVGRVEVSLARPTFTHMALTALWARGTLKFVVSQNCDGLHLRAGLPRRALAELHGDMFAERCAACRAVVLRAFDTTERTRRHAHGTRRLCHGCGQELRDSIVHFGERGRAAWPLNWAGALRHAARADVVLCLGSSLKVLRRYPRLWRMRAPPAARPALYIVNLQWTPKDAVAALKINARVDAVMRQVARRLRLRVPPYRPTDDPLLAHAEPLAPPERHTTRRPLLRLQPEPSADDDDDDDDDDERALSSPSASDSDEDVPLRRLAERLRAPPPAPPPPLKLPPPATRPPPDLLRAFQVSMRSGEATILLRAQHAPTPGLRAYGRPRAPATHDAPPPQQLDDEPPKLDLNVEPDLALKPEPGVKDEKLDPDELDIKYNKMMNGSLSVKPAGGGRGCLRRLAGAGAGAGGGGGGGPGPEELAAAIIARAVLVCRAQLYPGLHTILAPRSPPHCAWCQSRRGSARCLWYGPPRLTPLAQRVWRRCGARRALCVCCERAPDDDGGGGGGDDDGGGGGGGGGGWYGKGYRKGRRRRR